MKVMYSGLGVVDARGKINGHVASKNRAGNYFRTKVSPVNPQTDFQQNVRGRFGARSAAWRGLTDAQRQSWIDAAPSFPVVNVFGESKILSGFQLYNALNLNLELIGEAAITTAPAPAAIPSLVSADIDTMTATEVSVELGIGTVPAGFACVVFGTPSYGAGISFVKNKFRFIGSYAAAVTTNPLDVTTNYEVRFGNVTAGQKVSLRCFLVSTTTGQAGVPFSATSLAS